MTVHLICFFSWGVKVSLPHPYGGGVWLLNGKAPVRVANGGLKLRAHTLLRGFPI